MKKTMLTVLAVLLLSMTLTACNAGRTMDETPATASPEIGTMPVEPTTTPAAAPTTMPKPTGTPVPDVNDGYVNDDDGLITEGDNGPLETIPQTSSAPDAGKTETNRVG